MKVIISHCIRECPLATHHQKSNTHTCGHPFGFKVFALHHTGIPHDCPLRVEGFQIEAAKGSR